MNKKVGIISGVVVAILIIIYFVATFAAEKKVTDLIDSKIKSSRMDVKYDDVSVNLAGSTTTVHGVKFQNVKIDQVVLKDIYSYDYKNPIPSTLNLEVKGLDIDKKNINPKYLQTLKKLGYSDNLIMDVGLSYRYDQKNETLNVEDIKLDIPELFNSNMKVSIENIKLNLKNPGSMIQIMFLYPTYKISFCEINYRDDSLIKRMIELDAEKQGQTIESHKEKIGKLFDKKIKLSKNDGLKNFYTGLKKFILTPEKYTLRMDPEKPVTIKKIMRLKGPDEMISKLNMTFEQ